MSQSQQSKSSKPQLQSSPVRNSIQIMESALIARGCTLVEALVNKTTAMHYKCACGIIRKQLYKDFIRRNCKICQKKLNEEKEGDFKESDIIEDSGEIWRRIPGGWISSFGRARSIHSSNGKLLTLCPTKFRYSMNGRHEYASRLVAIAFEIPMYEQLNTQRMIVSHRDGNPRNNRVENLYVRSKENMNVENGQRSHQNHRNIDIIFTRSLEFRLIPELSMVHMFYKNGEVYNGTRFLEFSVGDKKYFCLSRINNCMRSYKVHRLICYAFNPLPGKSSLSDYDHLQVNHIDGNTFNNHADNLEWSTQSENMQHAYNTKLNNKVQGVNQYDLGGNLIASYRSIAEASRRTNVPEHEIRELARGDGIYSKRRFDWKFADQQKAKQYSEKYSK
jgi:hypothetical protein